MIYMRGKSKKGSRMGRDGGYMAMAMSTLEGSSLATEMGMGFTKRPALVRRLIASGKMAWHMVTSRLQGQMVSFTRSRWS